MANFTTLIVEDDQGFQFYMKRLMINDFPHIDVVQAFDGTEALDHCDKATNKTPDLILLDINMPGMNAFEFLDEWQKRPHKKKAKIVIITSSDFQEDRDKARTYGCVSDYMLKPISAEAFGRLMPAQAA